MCPAPWMRRVPDMAPSEATRVDTVNDIDRLISKYSEWVEKEIVT